MLNIQNICGTLRGQDLLDAYHSNRPTIPVPADDINDLLWLDIIAAGEGNELDIEVDVVQ